MALFPDQSHDLVQHKWTNQAVAGTFSHHICTLQVQLRKCDAGKHVREGVAVILLAKESMAEVIRLATPLVYQYLH